MVKMDSEKLFKVHSDLCNKVNLEPNLISESWKNFVEIKENYTLEGEDMRQWLACAIYITNYKQETTLPKSSYVNLISLLTQSNLSFHKFFFNLTLWVKMCNLPEDISNRIKELNTTFSVTYNTFKEYETVFVKVFKQPDITELEIVKQQKTKRQKVVNCTPAKLFEFIWNLFLVIKSEKVDYSSDLIKSFHLLYACVDLVFKNVFVSDATDLLNPDFEGLPKGWNNPLVANKKAPCIITNLCKSANQITNVKHLKFYVFKEDIKKLISLEILALDKEELTGLFDEGMFDKTFKKLANSYEAQFVSKEEFDERIFIIQYKRDQVEADNLKNDREAFLVPESPRNKTPAGLHTPLTGRRYLSSLREVDKMPDLARLHSLVVGRTGEPSDNLKQIFQSCSTDPTEMVQEVVSNLSEKFKTKFLAKLIDENEKQADEYLQLGTALFYRFLENILERERSIRTDISKVASQKVFLQCIFVASMQLVLFASDNWRRFPWILKALEVEAFQFVKIIELIVRTKEKLSRDMIKHLNRIDETILDSLAWVPESQLWEAIRSSNQPIPKYQDVALSDRFVNSKPSEPNEPLLTPLASQIFQSPINPTSTVPRTLFPSTPSNTLLLTDQNGVQKLIPIVDMETKPLQQELENNEAKFSPKRTGGLAIFFRKFYNVASVRMQEIVNCLNMTNLKPQAIDNLQQKMWTVFEESICNHVELMRGRQLDQLLMCAIYVILKVSEHDGKFIDIMKVYRNQPQATSQVYRDVLIKEKQVTVIDGETVVIPEVRKDLIDFYNTTYVEIMRPFALKFLKSHQNDPLLSPLPSSRKSLPSPSVQVIGNVFVRPLESPTNEPTNKKTMQYCFSRSPSSDLKEINKAILNNNGVTGKRLLVDGDSDIPTAKRISNRKIQTMVEERLNHFND